MPVTPADRSSHASFGFSYAGNVPAEVGLPAIAAPDVGEKFDSVTPGGRPPDAIDQLYGRLPPVALMVSKYPPPTKPETRGDAVTMVNCCTDPLSTDNMSAQMKTADFTNAALE
jgi:hypothetical protein